MCESEEWKVGKCASTVVSNKKQRNTNFPIPPNPEESREEDIEYFGGYLVCESIANKLTAEKIATLPEAIQVILSIENDDNSIPKGIWDRVQKLKLIYSEV